MKKRTHGFTLVELLVVVGIVAVLIAILLPALQRARERALQINCMSNMRQVGWAVTMYRQDNKWFYPSMFNYYPDSQLGPNNRLWPFFLWKYIGKYGTPAYRDTYANANIPANPTAPPLNTDIAAERRNIFYCPSADLRMGKDFGNPSPALTYTPASFSGPAGERIFCTYNFLSGIGYDNRPTTQADNWLCQKRHIKFPDRAMFCCDGMGTGSTVGQFRMDHSFYFWHDARHYGGLNMIMADSSVQYMKDDDFINAIRFNGYFNLYQTVASGRVNAW